MKHEKWIIFLLTSVVIVFAMDAYIDHQKVVVIGQEIEKLEEVRVLLKSNLQYSSQAPEPPIDPISFFDWAGFGVYVIAIVQLVKSKIFDKFGEFVGDQINTVFWYVNTYSFGWYLLFPWNKFPTALKMTYGEITNSKKNQFLFEMFKISLFSRNFCGNKNNIGTSKQFKADTTFDMQEFFKKVLKSTKKFVNTENNKKFQDVRSFWVSKDKKMGTSSDLFLLQTTFLSLVGKPTVDEFTDYLACALEFVKKDALIELDKMSEANIKTLAKLISFGLATSSAKEVEDLITDFQENSPEDSSLEKVILAYAKPSLKVVQKKTIQ